jgi:hypothetical protein
MGGHLSPEDFGHAREISVPVAGGAARVQEFPGGRGHGKQQVTRHFEGQFQVLAHQARSEGDRSRIGIQISLPLLADEW